MSRTIYFYFSLTLSVAFFLTVLMVSSGEDESNHLDFYYGEDNQLRDNDFFDDLDYSMDIEETVR